jgi:hypothetical protein
MQGQYPDLLLEFERKQSLVAGHDDYGAARHCALEYSVVCVIFHDSKPSFRSDDHG